MKRIGFVVLIWILTGPVYGSNLTAPFDLEGTDVLPKGRFNPRVKSIYLTIDSRFNDEGTGEGLGAKLNKTVYWRDVVKSKPTPEEKAEIQGFLSKNNLSLDGTAGSTTGTVYVNGQVTVPVLGYGITDNLTVALAVPIYKMDVRVETGFVRSGESEALVNSLKQGSEEKAHAGASQLNNAINGKAVQNGYKPLQSESFSAAGDAKLIAKYMLHKTADDAVGVKGEITVPTGTPPDPDKVVDVSTGDGQWDVGTYGIWDHYLGKGFRTNVYGGMTIQLPDYLDRRIPQERGDPISPDKEGVYRDSGDIFAVGTSINYGAFQETLLLGVGYSYQYMTQTRFSGSQYSGERYGYLEELYPSQELHAMTYRVGFSTVDRFKAGSFVYPFQTYLVYSRPIAGRNTSSNDLVAAELVLFF